MWEQADPIFAHCSDLITSLILSSKIGIFIANSLMAPAVYNVHVYSANANNLILKRHSKIILR